MTSTRVSRVARDARARAEAALAAGGDADLLARLGEVLEHQVRLGVVDDRAGRHADDEVLAVSAVTVLALAVAAAPGDSLRDLFAREVGERWSGRAEPGSVSYRLVRSFAFNCIDNVYRLLVGRVEQADERFRASWLPFRQNMPVTPITDHNAWLADRQLARQEMIRYTARDGVEIDGLLIHPLDGVPSGGGAGTSTTTDSPSATPDRRSSNTKASPFRSRSARIRVEARKPNRWRSGPMEVVRTAAKPARS